MRTPARAIEPSPRPYPARVPEPEYGSALTVRRVRRLRPLLPGNTRTCFSARCWTGERIGLLPIDERYYRVYFATFPWRGLIAGSCASNVARRGSSRGGAKPPGRRGNLEIAKAAIPTFPRTTTTRTDVEKPKPRIKSVKYVPGLKCKVCPRLDRRSSPERGDPNDFGAGGGRASGVGSSSLPQSGTHVKGEQEYLQEHLGGLRGAGVG